MISSHFEFTAEESNALDEAQLITRNGAVGSVTNRLLGIIDRLVADRARIANYANNVEEIAITALKELTQAIKERKEDGQL